MNALLLFCMSSAPLKSQINGKDYIGRWDLNIEQGEQKVPSWLEITKSGRETLLGRFVYAFGSARPIAHVRIGDGGHFSFDIPHQWEPAGELSFTGHIEQDRISGTMTYTDGKTYSWTGERAPTLERMADPIWGSSKNLFNGEDLAGWHVKGTNKWSVEDGLLKNSGAGGNLISDDTFTDFKLRVVFKYPEGSNSGVYLRGRYEVQIEDNHGQYPSPILFGGIYGFLSPNHMAAKKAGEWQEFVITLIGRRVSVVANGHTVISDQIIPGITGGALDSKEGTPGPLLIQGDHGPIDFKLIEITPSINQ